MAKLLLRQGDVLLQRVEKMPTSLQRQAREEGRIVLAHGEATGHAHAIREPGCELYQMSGERYLEVTAENCVLRHEEHAPIPLPVGIYRVLRQREYDPATEKAKGGPRYVRD
jgi:hypothetical protein